MPPAQEHLPEGGLGSLNCAAAAGAGAFGRAIVHLWMKAGTPIPISGNIP